MKTEISFVPRMQRTRTDVVNRVGGAGVLNAMRLYDPASHRSVPAVSLQLDTLGKADKPSIVFGSVEQRLRGIGARRIIEHIQ